MYAQHGVFGKKMAASRQELTAADVQLCEAATLDNTDNLLCWCQEVQENIAYNCKGCLKCTSLDCAYYIQNMVENFVKIHNVHMYDMME